MVAQDETVSQRLPSEHSDNESGRSKTFHTVFDAPSDNEEPRTAEAVHQTIMKRKVTEASSDAASQVKQTPTGPEKKSVGFDVVQAQSPSAIRSE